MPSPDGAPAAVHPARGQVAAPTGAGRAASPMRTMRIALVGVPPQDARVMLDHVLEELLEVRHVRPGGAPARAADLVVVGPLVRDPLEEAGRWAAMHPHVRVAVIVDPEEEARLAMLRRDTPQVHFVPLRSAGAWFLRDVQRTRLLRRCRDAGAGAMDLQERARELI